MTKKICDRCKKMEDDMKYEVRIFKAKWQVVTFFMAKNYEFEFCRDCFDEFMKFTNKS